MIEEPEKAIAIYEKYLELNGNDLEVSKRYAHLLLSMGEYDQCYDRILEGLMQYHPHDSEVLTMAGIYFIQMEYLNDAEVMFKNSLAIQANSVDTWYQYAVLLNKMDRFK